MMHLQVSRLVRGLVIIALHQDAGDTFPLALELKLFLTLHLAFNAHLSLLCVHVGSIIAKVGTEGQRVRLFLPHFLVLLACRPLVSLLFLLLSPLL